jgi:AbiV family abortive infection protein
LGKSQVVADYFYELVTSAEFEAAFREHRFKTAYAKRYVAIPDDLSQEWFIEYDPKVKTPGFQTRNAALYVEHAPDNSPSTPAQAISPERAAELVATAEAYLVELCRMAAISERIGTKAFTK